MKLFKSEYVDEGNHRFYMITQWAYLVGFVGHISALRGFSNLGVPEMVYVNIFYSIPTFIIAFILNRRGKHNLAFTLAFIELLAHQVLSTYFLGWDFGAHYWLLYLAGLCFFNPSWRTSIQIGLLAVVLGSYVYMYFNFETGVYPKDISILRPNRLTSALVTITIISLLISYYSKTAKKAETKLKAAQKKTASMLAKVESLFGQQVSQEIAQELIHSDINFDSKQYDVSVMFVDIRDFTRFADTHVPSEVAQFQNAVFSELIDIVKSKKGVVLQILGDGIMAVFGAPIVNLDHAQLAVEAGQQMIAKIESLGNENIIPKIRVGIGVNSGTVIAGNLGNISRRFYSLTGKHVIIAARIEQLNKQYGSQFLISEFTFNKLSRTPTVENLGKVMLKGIENQVGLYKIV